MHTTRTILRFACHSAALSFLMAGTASLGHAQVASSVKAPFFLASSAVPDFTAASSSSSSSDSDTASAADDSLRADALDSAQPPPRRRYGRPNYSSGNTNPDGSSKFAFMGGFGLTLPVGDTHYYETPAWGLQVGGGRNFNKNVGVLLQFDYDHFGLQGATIANQNYIYDYGCSAAAVAAGNCGVSGLDGNNHVWSFTLDPTFTMSSEGSLGTYLVVGGGFYHKVTNFTEPTTETVCYYYCGVVGVNANIDHYTSNAGGVNGGIGFTYKVSHFSSEKLYMEARYVLIFNQNETGLTAANVGTTFGANYTGTDYYPANTHRTSYIPIKFGIRF